MLALDRSSIGMAEFASVYNSLVNHVASHLQVRPEQYTLKPLARKWGELRTQQSDLPVHISLIMAKL